MKSLSASEPQSLRALPTTSSPSSKWTTLTASSSSLTENRMRRRKDRLCCAMMSYQYNPQEAWKRSANENHFSCLQSTTNETAIALTDHSRHDGKQCPIRQAGCPLISFRFV